MRSFFVKRSTWREERDEHYATHGKGKREAMERRLPGSFGSGRKR
jgi:hypothetical protein